MNGARVKAADSDAGDGELLAAAARGDAVAFGQIVNRHYLPVYRLVWRMSRGHADSEDIAQDAFMKLWQNPLQVREAGALKGWLMRVAANAVIDRARKPVIGNLDDVPEIADARELQDAGFDRQQAGRIVDRAIAALPERQRLALSLVYYEGMSNIDAATALETSVEAVESLLARARRGLKQSLSQNWRELLDGLGARPM